MPETDNYQHLKNKAREFGAHLFGVAAVSWDSLEISPELAGLKGKYPCAISIGIGLVPDVLKTIINQPTLVYSWHYRQINSLLDQAALRLSDEIISAGFSALPVAASQVTDWKRQKAHLSHKHIAYLAGLGWRGRNNLIVNPRFGSGVRFVSILTDMPLKCDKPLSAAAACGSCEDCLKACPAGAISNKREDFGHQKCFEKLTQFSRLSGIKYHICGICIKACRAGRDGKDNPGSKT